MIKIEFPADRADIALAFSVALQQLATGTAGFNAALAERLKLAEGVTPEAVIETMAAAQGVAQVLAVGTVNTSTGEVIEEELPATVNDLGRRDLKGVAFDERYCADAQDPFYSSGKEKGQWKAKRGLAAGVYDNWYTKQLASATPLDAPADEDIDPTPTVATGAAFGAAASTLVPAPQTAGEFMAWVSEKQTAGKLAQDVINGAYASLGVRVQDLFPPTPEHVVANNVRALHQYLAQAAGA